MESLRQQQHLRILLLAMETTGVYYWAWWDFLSGGLIWRGSYTMPVLQNT